MIPLYGFLQGDTIGLLMLADGKDTVRSLRDRLKVSAAVRVKAPADGNVIFEDRKLSLDANLESAGLTPLDRFDVVWD